MWQRRLESNLAELGFKGLLKRLQIGGGWFVSLLLGANTEPAHLVEVPHAALAVAESHAATDKCSWSRHGIDAKRNLSGAGGCGSFFLCDVVHRFLSSA